LIPQLADVENVPLVFTSTPMAIAFNQTQIANLSILSPPDADNAIPAIN